MDYIIAMAHRRMSRKAGRKSKKAQKTRKSMGKSMRNRLSKRGGLKRGGLSRRVKKGGRTEDTCSKYPAACDQQDSEHHGSSR